MKLRHAGLAVIVGVSASAALFSGACADLQAELLEGTDCNSAAQRAVCDGEEVEAHCNAEGIWELGQPSWAIQGCGCKCIEDTIGPDSIGEMSCCVIGYAGVSVAGRSYDTSASVRAV